ncbi:Notch3 [Symbiodinium sp. CCMP2456]|nr:Notch3 [Symbiodinium sp. CCMP2456]
MEIDPKVLVDRAAGAILGVFIGDALGVGVHWQYDLDKLEKDRGFVTGYLDPLPGSFHSGTSDAPGKGQLKAGQLEQQGEVTKLLLQSLASKGCLDQEDFHDRFEKEILREDTMDGTRQGGKYGWTDKTICDFYKARVVHNKPWAECVLPRSDTPDTIVRGALIASSYFLSPRAMCCQVQAHSKAFTGDSSVQAHSVAFAVLLAGIIQGLPLDKGLSWRMYTQAGDPLPFSSVHSDKDHDDDYGDYTEPDSLLWYGMLAEGVQNCATGIEPPHRGVELYGKFCAFYGVLGSAYYCAARYPDDFEKAVLCSLNGGGQNTMRTSLVGAFLGGHVGLKGIPQKLIDGLDDHDNIVALAMQVAQHAIDRSSPSDAWKWPSDEPCFSKTVQAFLCEKSGRMSGCEWAVLAAANPLFDSIRSIGVSYQRLDVKVTKACGVLESWNGLLAQASGLTNYHTTLDKAVKYETTESEAPAADENSANGAARWGDLFAQASGVLWKLDSIWFTLVSAVALAIVFWRPAEIVGTNRGSRESKHKPIPWYSVLFAALSSHAAGIVGFVGFQKTVVARIVSCSHPQTPWTWSGLLADCLLYASMATSIIAILASLVFLGVDYMRRLAMDSGRSSGLRLVLKPGRIERTGLGVLLIILTALLLVLYLSVIVVEASKKDSRVDRLLLCERVFSGTTVLLYFLNLRSLCESPKVQAHTTCGVRQQETDLKDFLVQCCGDNEEGRSNGLRKFLADGLGYIAGEDLALFVRLGSRRAFFPTQRHAPLLHVVGLLLFLGALPGAFHLMAERLFAKPEIVDVKPFAAILLPRFDRLSERTDYLVLVDSDSGTLRVKPKFEQASNVRLCCGASGASCSNHSFEHSLMRFDDNPAVLEFGANPTNCTLIVSGHASQATTKLRLRVEQSTDHHLSDCSELGCKCRDGYRGGLNVSTFADGSLIDTCSPAPCAVEHSNRQAGSECDCRDGYYGDISWDGKDFRGNCIPAPCNITHSNMEDGWKCRCRDRFAGSLYWNGSTPRGVCSPAICAIENSTGRAGEECECSDGFAGNIVWEGQTLQGTCQPAPCNIQNSTRDAGLDCKCRSGFEGSVEWSGATPTGSCQPVPCGVVNSNKAPGDKCRCEDGFAGAILWSGTLAKGSCNPAPCNVANSSGQGLNCRCEHGLEGVIHWNGSEATGRCAPAPCNITNSNRMPGHKCKCKDGYDGTIDWELSTAKGTCEPAACTIKNSNRANGPKCVCLDGYAGSITWQGSAPQGSCKPAFCNKIANTNGKRGTACACRDGFLGNISWQGSVASGSCFPAPCMVENSDKIPGPDCRCLDGFAGIFAWKGSMPMATCKPMPCTGVNSNSKVGPECDCLDGFVGKRRLNEWEDAYELDCRPALCTVENSNGQDGHGCGCKSGFMGTITWAGARPQGSCSPAPCVVPNSNRQPGLACKCGNGFRGKVTWRGRHPDGSCDAVRCRVSQSDFAPGPSCSCAEGFFGNITWFKESAAGDCRPLPVCSEDIVHVTTSVVDVEDLHGKICRAGQGFTVRGSTCNQTTGAIQWIADESRPHGNCSWRWSGSEADCHTTAHTIRMLRGLKLPTHCSKHAARPRCSSQIEYVVTSPQASRYACGNVSLPDEYEIVTFRGHRCGYDLISWDTASITVLSKTCTYKLSSACGDIPDGEQLPKSCRNSAEPATFVWQHVDRMPETVKFFDDGSFTLEPGQNGKKTWQSDGVYLSLQKKFASERMRWGFRRYLDEPEDEGDLDELDEHVGFHFFDRTTDELKAKWKTLPSWWVFKFQQISSRASFNADRLVGCEKSFSHQDACYKIVFGQEIWTTADSKSYCDFGQVAKPAWRKYVYSYSAFGVQMYRSATPCLPIAAYEEIQLTVTDVNLPEEEFAYATTDAPCRRTIGIATAARALDSKCQNAYEVVYTNGRNVGAALKTFNWAFDSFGDEDEDDDEDEDGLD